MLNKEEKKIITALLERGTYDTTNYYANTANVSWNTAFFYLEKLARRNWIYHVKKGNRHFWKIEIIPTRTAGGKSLIRTKS